MASLAPPQNVDLGAYVRNRLVVRVRYRVIGGRLAAFRLRVLGLILDFAEKWRRALLSGRR